MASSSNDRSSKHHKLSTKKLIRTDRISLLPDPLLCCILSFLTTREAAATSILSKRWQYLWTLVPILDVYDLDLYLKDTSFGDTVTKIMLSRNTSCIIRVFTLCALASRSDNLHESQIQSWIWICSAVSSNVEELYVNINYLEEDYQLPTSLVSCQTLTVLKLVGPFVLNVPSSIHLPRLKVLHLMIIISYDDNSFHNLISACPVLDELVLYKCHYHGILRYEVFSSTMTTLALHSCLVKINTPALKSLGLNYSLFAEPPINKLNSLVEASVDDIVQLIGQLNGEMSREQFMQHVMSKIYGRGFLQ